MKKIQQNTRDPIHRQSIFKIIKKKKPGIHQKRAVSQSIYSRFRKKDKSKSNSYMDNRISRNGSRSREPKPKTYKTHKKTKNFMIRTMNSQPPDRHLKKPKNQIGRWRQEISKNKRDHTIRGRSRGVKRGAEQIEGVPVLRKSIWSIITTDIKNSRKRSINSMRRRGAISVHSSEMGTETVSGGTLKAQPNMTSQYPLFNPNIPEILLDTNEIEESNRLFDFLEKKYLLKDFDLLNRAKDFDVFEDEIETENQALYEEYEALELEIEKVAASKNSQVQTIQKIELDNLERLARAAERGRAPVRGGRPRIETRDKIEFGEVAGPNLKLESRLVKWKKDNQKLDRFLMEVLFMFVDRSVLQRELPWVQGRFTEEREAERLFLGAELVKKPSIGLKTIRYDVGEEGDGTVAVTSIQSRSWG